MEKNKDIKLIQVFSGTSWEAGVVKSLLENAEIQVYMKDEVRGTMAPWHLEPGGLGAVKLIVAEIDEGKALEVVNSYLKNKE
jgi:hypothetical protein